MPQGRTYYEGSVGAVVWAKLGNSPWWPGVVVDGKVCGMAAAPSTHVWVYWPEDYRVSKVSRLWVRDFKENFTRFFNTDRKPRAFVPAAASALKVCARRVGHDPELWTTKEALDWAQADFLQCHGHVSYEPVDLPEEILDDLELIKNRRAEQQSDSESPPEDNVPEPRHDAADDIKKVKRSVTSIENLCLGCKSSKLQVVTPHPYFKGSLCQRCAKAMRKNIFEFGDDGVHMRCAICGCWGHVFVCSNTNCHKVYCYNCVDLLAAPNARLFILKKNPWACFLCDTSRHTFRGVIEARHDWRTCEKITSLISEGYSHVSPKLNGKSGLRVWSVFDGIGLGMMALKKLAMEVDKYFACEEDTEACVMSQLLHGDAVTRLGDFKNMTHESISALGHIDLLIGGSPDIKMQAYYETRDMMFFDFFRLLVELRRKYKRDLFWVYENTAMMSADMRAVVSRFLICNPVVVDASWLPAKHRARLIWSNIPGVATSLFPVVHMDQHPTRRRQRTFLPTQQTRDGTNLQVNALLFGLPDNVCVPNQLLLERAWSLPILEHILHLLRTCMES